jgi:hypothetical protein
VPRSPHKCRVDSRLHSTDTPARFQFTHSVVLLAPPSRVTSRSWLGKFRQSPSTGTAIVHRSAFGTKPKVSASFTNLQMHAQIHHDFSKVSTNSAVNFACSASAEIWKSRLRAGLLLNLLLKPRALPLYVYGFDRRRAPGERQKRWASIRRIFHTTHPDSCTPRQPLTEEAFEHSSARRFLGGK